MDSPGAAYTQFGFSLFQKLNKIQDGNIFFSPVGISAAIGMLVLEAQEAALVQLQKMLFFEKDAEGSKVKTEEQMKYLDYVEKYYHASLEPVDFVNAADETRKKINSWVESQTNEKIKDLFPDGSLNSFTKLVLVNIVYFKGQWDREFKKENTKEEEFWLNKSTSKSVPMMTQCHSFSFNFLEDLQAQILGIPYKNNDLSMFVLLPNDIDGLDKIIDQITPEKLIEWTSPGHMKERNVILHLPRFEVEDGYDLEAVLSAMGMGEAFSVCRADYPGMSSHSRLHAQKFLHRSFVVVTEEGTESSAATSVGFALTSAPGCEHFHCNHPFLFFIKHQESNSILFFGRFSSP
ncbi:serpin B13 isoform X3 [Mustela erminea]|uniref:serpin B13 isoform X3 n=1 Tax=Mustela erminea TaxID=36723 RepID=UPI0013875655|nr:serpin B13 isoform X3 [Mustela erminea]